MGNLELVRMYRKAVAVTTVAATLTLGGIAGAAGADVTWIMNTHAGGNFLKFTAQGFADKVAELTEGRVTINVAEPGMLGSGLSATKLVADGIAEVGTGWGGYDQGIDMTGTLIGGWPGGLRPEGWMFWLYEGGGVQLIRDWREEKFGVVSFPCHIAETEIFLHSHKPVRTLADFEGLRVRTSGAWAEIAANLGASTVVIPADETFPALERKIVDAIEWTGPGANLDFGFHKIARYIVTPGVHFPAGMSECMVNKDAYESLSDHDRKMIEFAAKLNTLESYAQYGMVDLDAWADFKTFASEGSNEFTQLDDEFIKAAQEGADAWAEQHATNNDWFKRIYDSQQAMQKKLEAWSEFRLPVGQSR